MQDIIVSKPYKFIPPHRGTWIPTFIQKFKLIDKYLNFFEGVNSHEVRNVDRIKDSLSAGHSILLAPNHCRYADPLSLVWIARELDVFFYAIASWHLFHQSRLQGFAIRMCGGFSLNREGIDKKSMDTAIEILASGERPLVLFPEGTVFRTNDRLSPLLDGVSFIARSAARRRAKADLGQVVIHPVAIKYLFKGDVAEAVEPILCEIEERLDWGEFRRPLPLLERVNRISESLLALKEIQYLGCSQSGPLKDRKNRLIERLLSPIETLLLGRSQVGSIIPRIKQLRTKIVPGLSDNRTTESQRRLIWQQLQEIYIAQQIWCYPEGYLDQPTNMRVLETVERLEEDLKDRARVHRPLHAILEVGEAIEVDPQKPGREEQDPITRELQTSLQGMLERLSTEAKTLVSEPVPGD